MTIPVHQQILDAVTHHQDELAATSATRAELSVIVGALVWIELLDTMAEQVPAGWYRNPYTQQYSVLGHLVLLAEQLEADKWEIIALIERPA